jgi:hypothetical protein
MRAYRTATNSCPHNFGVLLCETLAQNLPPLSVTLCHQGKTERREARKYSVIDREDISILGLCNVALIVADAINVR